MASRKIELGIRIAVLFVLVPALAAAPAAQSVGPLRPPAVRPQERSSSGAPATEWKFEQSVSELDGKITQVIYQQSPKPVLLWLESEAHVTLSFDCARAAGGAAGPVTASIGVRGGFENGATGMTRYWTRVRFRFRRGDGTLSPIREEDWFTYDRWATPKNEGEIDPGKYLNGKSPNAALFIAEVQRAEALIMEFTPFKSGSQTATFDLRDLGKSLAKLTACRVP
jgi:hypothetical protein